MKRETELLRIGAAAAINVYAARYVARMFGIAEEAGSALAVAAMLYRAQFLLEAERANASGLESAPHDPTGLLARAAEILTWPGSAAVGLLAESAAEGERLVRSPWLGERKPEWTEYEEEHGGIGPDELAAIQAKNEAYRAANPGPISNGSK